MTNQLQLINDLGTANVVLTSALDELLTVVDRVQRANRANQIALDPMFDREYRVPVQADADLEDLAELLVNVRDAFGTKAQKLNGALDSLEREIEKRPKLTASMSESDREILEHVFDARQRVKNAKTALDNFYADRRRQENEEARQNAERERLFAEFLAEREEERRREEAEAERRRNEETRAAFDAWLKERQTDANV